MNIAIMQGITTRIKELIERIFSMLGMNIEPEIEIKYITEYVPYRGMDYFMFVGLSIMFGLCTVVLIMKHKNLIKEINSHEEKPKRRRKA